MVYNVLGWGLPAHLKTGLPVRVLIYAVGSELHLSRRWLHVGRRAIDLP